MRAVFRHGMDAVSKNPVELADGRLAPSGKALFFGSFLLGQQKKRTRPPQADGSSCSLPPESESNTDDRRFALLQRASCLDRKFAC